MENLDALLADLHRTVSHADGGFKVDGDVSSPNSSGYGSISHSTLTSRPAHGGGSSQKIITTTEKTMTEKSCNNNNLSELDTLLQDLNNARYSGGLSERVIQTTQVTNTCSKPTGKTHVNGVQETRPSVNSLLDELSTVVDYDNSPSQTSRYSGTQPSASSATKELDDLMASLSGFNIPAKVSAPATTTIQRTDHTIIDSAYAKPFKVVKSEPSEKGKQLDCMLGNLHADMSKQGVNTTQKGCCCACNKPIVGEVVTALGKTWHMEHFTCSHCGEELGKKQFFERDGVPYCEDDYHKLFSPRCAYCNGAILDKCVTALDKTWHPDHFFCARCGKPFGDDGFHEKDGKPYCREDFFQMFAPRCGGCNRPIMDNYISALNAQWHPECFVCRDCQESFGGKSFYTVDGKPVCAKCSGVGEDDAEEEEEEEEEEETK